MRITSFLIALFLLACQQKKQDVSRIQGTIHQTMVHLNKEGSFIVDKKNRSLAISFTFGDNAFLDKNSNLVLFAYLIHELDESLSDVDSLIIQYDFESLTAEKENFIYNKKNIVALSKDLAENPMYKEMLTYSLQHLDGYTLVQLNTLLEQLSKLDSTSSFSSDKGFFDLMREYSMEACETDSSIVIQNWIELTKAAGYPRFKINAIESLDSVAMIRNRFCDH